MLFHHDNHFSFDVLNDWHWCIAEYVWLHNNQNQILSIQIEWKCKQKVTFGLSILNRVNHFAIRIDEIICCVRSHKHIFRRSVFFCVQHSYLVAEHVWQCIDTVCVRTLCVFISLCIDVINVNFKMFLSLFFGWWFVLFIDFCQSFLNSAKRLSLD